MLRGIWSFSNLYKPQLISRESFHGNLSKALQWQAFSGGDVHETNFPVIMKHVIVRRG